MGGALATLTLVVATVEGAGLRLQHTASLPKGVYRVVRGTPPARLLKPGAIGLWCLPSGVAEWANARGYLRPGRCPSGVEPLAKMVLATTGDTVDFDGSGVRVGGRVMPYTQPVLRDAAGRSLTPVPFGRYVLRAGQAWVWSPYTPRSFDSRYIGPLPPSTLIGVVRPVLTLPARRP